ncbi:hypothetical protein M9458_056349 [Cirrhinus mrigala]|uniref:Retrotransposon gag domain-containing protein n=1 Tax=Cirrhinus mrigala TaxID=683832 RepID=A0ABD0MF10_CIRMR
MSTETPAAVDPLIELVNAFKAALIPTTPPPPASGCPMAVPATFAGLSVAVFFYKSTYTSRSNHNSFPQRTPKSLSSFLLTGKALQWVKAIWNSNNPIINSYEQFTSHFSEVFSTVTGTLTTSDQLFQLQQGSSSVNEYTLAAASVWNEVALLGPYRQGLNPEIRTAMALYNDSIGLES